MTTQEFDKAVSAFVTAYRTRAVQEAFGLIGSMTFGFNADEEPASWITLENGEHVPLDENGTAIGGAGGWAKGKDFSGAKSQKKAAPKAAPAVKKTALSSTQRDKYKTDFDRIFDENQKELTFQAGVKPNKKDYDPTPFIESEKRQKELRAEADKLLSEMPEGTLIAKGTSLYVKGKDGKWKRRNAAGEQEYSASFMADEMSGRLDRSDKFRPRFVESEDECVMTKDVTLHDDDTYKGWASDLGTMERKDLVKKAKKDPEFKELIDTVVLYTEGGYADQRMMLEKAGKTGLKNADAMTIGEYVNDTPYKIRNLWKGQELEGSESSMVGGMAHLNEVINASEAVDKQLYRVAQDRNIAKAGDVEPYVPPKVGDKIRIDAPTSFTDSLDVEQDISHMKMGDVIHYILEPGAKAVNVAELSRYKQSEYLSSGQFEVTDIKTEKRSAFVSREPSIAEQKRGIRENRWGNKVIDLYVCTIHIRRIGDANTAGKHDAADEGITYRGHFDTRMVGESHYHADRAYDEWLEENLDKFESDEEEIEFRDFEPEKGLCPKTCDDVDEIDMLWDRFTGSRRDGGPGSGNFGHKGRPGEVGGSSPGDGPDMSEKSPDALYLPSKRKMNRQISDMVSKFINGDTDDDEDTVAQKIGDILETLEPRSVVTVPGNSAGDEKFTIKKVSKDSWTDSYGFYFTSKDVATYFLNREEEERAYISKCAMSEEELEEDRRKTEARKKARKAQNFRNRESAWSGDKPLTEKGEVTLQKEDLGSVGRGYVAKTKEGEEYTSDGICPVSYQSKDGSRYLHPVYLNEDGAVVTGDYFDIYCGLNGASKETVYDIREAYKRMPANVQKKYEKTFRTHGVFSSDSGGAYFQLSTGNVYLASDTEPGTFFHEMSHALDEGSVDLEYTIFGGSKIRVTSASRNMDHLCGPVSSKYEADFETMSKIIGFKTNGEGWFASDAERNDAITPFMKWSKKYEHMKGFDCVSDCISAMTLDYSGGSLITGGHSKSYWSTVFNGRSSSMQNKEYWANFCELKAMGCTDALKLLKTICPNRYAAAEATYKEVFKDETESDRHRVTVGPNDKKRRVSIHI